MADTSFWDSRRGRIHSRRGGWVVGEAVYNCGYSMLDDLVGKSSYFQVLLLNVTGRLPERRLADWWEAVFNCLSWPDARIWCNQVGSLAGTAGTTPVAAVTAGVLTSDSSMYGPRTLLEAHAFITSAMSRYQAGTSVADIVASRVRRPGDKPLIVGYARPLASGDKRVKVLAQVSADLGYEAGPHLSLAYKVEEMLLAEYSEAMNIAGYISAFLADLDFSGEEIYRMCTAGVMSGVLACYIEAAARPTGAFFPLHCSDIDYQGKAPRPLPGVD